MQRSCKNPWFLFLGFIVINTLNASNKEVRLPQLSLGWLKVLHMVSWRAGADTYIADAAEDLRMHSYHEKYKAYCFLSGLIYAMLLIIDMTQSKPSCLVDLEKCHSVIQYSWYANSCIFLFNLLRVDFSASQLHPDYVAIAGSMSDTDIFCATHFKEFLYQLHATQNPPLQEAFNRMFDQYGQDVVNRQVTVKGRREYEMIELQQRIYRRWSKDKSHAIAQMLHPRDLV